MDTVGIVGLGVMGSNCVKKWMKYWGIGLLLR